MVRAGEDVQIIDNQSKEDKTEVTLALIISEELKSQPRSVPLGTLRDLIHQRGERFLSQLREGPIGRLIPAADLSTRGRKASSKRLLRVWLPTSAAYTSDASRDHIG